MRFPLLPLLFVSVFAAMAQVRRGHPPPPKNLQLLQPSEVQAQMSAYRIALGVPCAYCHMPGADYASDDNPNKPISRRMITLTRHINAELGGGQVRVTCFTCHRGAQMPLPGPAQ